MADINLNIALSVQEAAKNVEKFTQQATKSLGGVENGLSELNKGMGAVTKNTGIANIAFGSFFGATLAGLGLKVLDATISAVKDLAHAFVVDGVKSAIQAEEAVKGLESALISSGRYSQEAVADLEDFAGAIQKTTKFSDDAVISTASLISSYASLSTDGLKQATQAALDFSTRFRVDVDTAARLVGKAAEGNIEAFKRYGISIKDTGDKGKNFSLVLDEIAKKANNAAVSAGNTFAGGIEKLKNNFDDAIKTFGKFVINNESVLSLITALNGVVTKLAELVVNNKDRLNEWISRLAYMTETIIVGTVKGIESLIGAFSKLSDFFDVHKGGFDEMNKSQRRFINDEDVIIKDFSTGKDIQIGKINELNDAIIKAANTQAESSGVISVNIGKEKEETDKLAASKANLLQINKDAAQQAIIESEKRDAALREQNLKEVNAYYERANQLRDIDAKKNADEIERLTLHGDLVIQDRTLKTQQELAELQAKYDQIQAIDATHRTAQQNAESQHLSEMLNKKQVALFEESRIADAQRLKEKQAKQKQDQEDRDLLNRKLDGTKTFFSGMSSLSRTGNKDLFEIGKAAALANAVVSGAQAFVNALAQVPYPFNIAAAAGIAVATGVEIATISAQKLATGMTEIPRGFNNDSFPALLSSGERVISVPQNQDLKSFMEEERGSRSMLASIAEKLDMALNRPIVIEINGREVFRAVSDELSAGRAFA